MTNEGGNYGFLSDIGFYDTAKTIGSFVYFGDSFAPKFAVFLRGISGVGSAFNWSNMAISSYAA